MTAPLTGYSPYQLNGLLATLRTNQNAATGGLGGINGFSGAAYGQTDVNALIQMLMALLQQKQGTADAATAAPTQAAGKKADNKNGVYKEDSAENKQMFEELNKELGVDPNKNGNKQDWIKKAESGDPNIKIVDGKTGQPKNKYEEGDVFVVKSQKYGEVKILAGGDGEMNGKDDKILSVGAQTATANAATGLNAINQAAPTAAANQVNAANTMADIGTAGGNLFNDGELNNLLAALMKAILEERGLAA